MEAAVIAVIVAVRAGTWKIEAPSPMRSVVTASAPSTEGASDP
jgi:hypothetical protein